MFSSSSRPIQPYESITPRPTPVGLIRWRSGFPKFNAMSSLGESSLPRPTYPEKLIRYIKQYNKTATPFRCRFKNAAYRIKPVTQRATDSVYEKAQRPRAPLIDATRP